MTGHFMRKGIVISTARQGTQCRASLFGQEEEEVPVQWVTSRRTQTGVLWPLGDPVLFVIIEIVLARGAGELRCCRRFMFRADRSCNI